MPYDAPEFTFLKNKTDNLQQSFAQLTKRYTSPAYLDLREKLLKLEDLYKKKLKEKQKGRWTKCEPDETRLDQIGCITQLANNMPNGQTAPNKEISFERAQSILIGSSLYRYARITRSYNILLGFFGQADDNSALNMALHEILGLSDDNSIDPLTWANCCSDYRNYLLKDDNYTSYSYINNDPDFFSNLEKMIVREQIKAQPMIKQLQYILFIQSVLRMIDSYPQKVMQLTNKLKTHLISQKAKITYPLDKSKLLSFLKILKADNDLYNIFNQFLPENYYITMLETKLVAVDDNGAKELEADISERITIYCQYALLAAYILVLTKLNEMQKLNSQFLYAVEYNEKKLIDDLKKSLKFAISEQDSNQVDDDTRNLALTSLQVFIDLNDQLVINTEAWGGFELFKGELHRQLVNVRHRLSETSYTDTTITHVM
ncbi:Uncharacterised protein [Legionella busanensis]|uniref:Substrate of the Dot/Icm secretion system n=1 Tax=Legionella busanensis TaxID=190655 RepID=A0A378JME5_9GAMM|nr:hypothetical protein [Legionella busanensis]STX51911.1 Uncharacterised protein [Legionella busanensis]